MNIPSPEQSRRELLVSTGIHARTGRPAAALGQAELVALADAIEQQRPPPRRSTTRSATLGPPSSLGDADSLRDMGWGIIWPPAPSATDERVHLAALKQALQPLVKLREEQMGAPAFAFEYTPGHSARDFLWMHEVTAGNMEPESVPYYLLLVGSPTQISWSFQYELDAEYAVGRLWFDDVADCRAYVQALVQRTQEAQSRVSREVLFVAPEQDTATQRSRTHLVDPLVAWAAQNSSRTGFAPRLLGRPRAAPAAVAVENPATLDNLLTSIRRSPPAVLFTASHGIEYDRGDPQQRTHQGALLLQDWAGHAPPQSNHLLSADALHQAARPVDGNGAVIVAFGCFSAGTPHHADWLPTALHEQQRVEPLADAPFVAQLPQALLARGAAAVIGHVSRAWMSSFLHLAEIHQGAHRYATQARPQIGPLRELLFALMHRQRVGHATDALNLRWVQLSATIDAAVSSGAPPEIIAALWLTWVDGRGWVVLGDPAARLTFG